MKIYKFKDLRDELAHPHLFQIIDENKIWCAAPDSLNDNKEFNFKLDYRPTRATENLLMEMIKKLGKNNYPPGLVASHAINNGKLEEFTKPQVDKIIQSCRSTIGVTSFSIAGSGPRLWEKYGGAGNGAAIEFDVSDSLVGKTFHRVEYVIEKVFHIDVLLEAMVGDPSKIFRKILCTKTKEDWANEHEIRFLGKRANVNVILQMPITKVTLGNNISEALVAKLIAHCQERGIKFGYHE